MQTIDQLFVAELRDAVGAERTVAAALERLSQCQSDPALQRTFGVHLAETRTQIDRLEQALSMLGAPTAPTLCEGMQGIVDEHAAFVLRHSPSPQVHAAFDAGVARRVEHYEIATYEHLTALADRLGYRQIAQLLEASLAEERQQLDRLGAVTLGASASGGQSGAGRRRDPFEWPRLVSNRQSGGQQRVPGQQQPPAQRPFVGQPPQPPRSSNGW